MPLIEPVMLDFFMFTKSIPLLSYLLGEIFQLLHLIKEAKYKFLQAEEYLEWIVDSFSCDGHICFQHFSGKAFWHESYIVVING